MTKAAILATGLTFFLASGVSTFAQAPAEEAAVNEAIYRQANRITLRQRLVEARTAQERGELAVAAKLYDSAWDLVQKIGTGVDEEAAQVRVGLAAVRLELARAAQKRGDLREARTQVADVIRVDPSNLEAQQFNRENEKMLRESVTKMPSEEAVNRVPGIVEEKVKAGVLVQDGKLFFEMGKLDDAEAKLKEAIKIDPAEPGRLLLYEFDPGAAVQGSAEQA
jgi:tetratricopeptide (TPR) repeat protein